MKRLALCIVRSGNPIKRPPEGRSLRDAPSVNGTQKQNAFSGASALFHVSSALFFHIFSRKRGWNQIATQRSGCNLERTSSEMYEFCRLRRNEEYGACEDEPAERRPLCRKPHRASGAFEKQQQLHFGYKKPPLRAAFHLPSQQSFAPAGMASSTISRCSFSSPFSLWTAEISIPQDWRPIILRGGRLIIATSVLPTSSSGL